MYVKIHEQIFSSSIMEEDVETRYIWFCLLTLADKEGFVDMTIPAIARRINVDISIVKSAIDKFLLSDLKSRTLIEDGRRLMPIRESFGWKVTNYEHYRDIKNNEEKREYMRNYMSEKRKCLKNVENSKNGNLTDFNVLKNVTKLTPQTQMDTQTDSQEKETPPGPPKKSQQNQASHLVDF